MNKNAIKKNAVELNDKDVINTSGLEFAIFCIESLAERLRITGDSVYKLLADQSDILDNYIFPEYEILHTQDKNYIVEDLMDVMRRKGVID